MKNSGYPSTKECGDSHQRRYLKQQAFERNSSSVEHDNEPIPPLAIFYSENKEDWSPIRTNSMRFGCVANISDTDTIDLKAEPHRIMVIWSLEITPS